MLKKIHTAILVSYATVAVLVALLAVALAAQEKLVLTTPLAAPPAVSEYDIAFVGIGRFPTWELSITWKDNTGKFQTDSHTGVFNATTNPNGADVLVKNLNKINLSIKSLEKRAIEHLQDASAHGGVAKIGTGTITGTPQ